MYRNKGNREFSIKGLNIIANTDNGAVVGVDDGSLEQYLNCEKNAEFEDLELQQFLVENEFISDVPINIKDRIESAYLHVTNRCNLNCVGCYSDNALRNKSDDLPIEVFDQVLHDLKELGLNSLVISGGEPLLYEGIEELLKRAKIEHDIENIILITNGTVGDVDLYSNLAEHVDTMAVSIDTFSRECPAFLRDEGIFCTIMDNIALMQKKGLNISLLPTLNHKNVRYIDRYLELAESIDAEISFSILTTDSSEIYEDFAIDDDDLKYISECIIEKDMQVQDAPTNDTLEGKLACEAGKKMLAISATGKVYPCHMLMDDGFVLGDIMSESLADIYNRHEFTFSVDNIKECSNCDYKYLCGGACRARAYLQSGNINGKDPFCLMFKRFHNAIIDRIIKAQSER